METIEIGIPLLLDVLKKELEELTVSTMCYYEGCGSDDGWPEVRPLIF